MSSENPYCEAKQIYPKQVYVDKTLIECHCLEEKVKVKNGTKKIASTAFSSSKVNEVTLPDSVEEIEPHQHLTQCSLCIPVNLPASMVLDYTKSY